METEEDPQAAIQSLTSIKKKNVGKRLESIRPANMLQLQNTLISCQWCNLASFIVDILMNLKKKASENTEAVMKLFWKVVGFKNNE